VLGVAAGGLMSLIHFDDDRPTIDKARLKTRPRAGMSLATLIHNPKHNLKEIVRIFNGCGVNWTRINLCSASWTNPTSYMPFEQITGGRWDLFQWDNRYWDRLIEVRERMNAANIVCQFTFLDLRNFSHREDSNLDQSGTPWRNNVNGVYWEKEDTILYRLPDEWCAAYWEKAAPLLDLDVNYVEPVNEGPEKDLHIRILRLVRSIVPNALVGTNRNEDTPTQYKNMKIGAQGSFDLIAFHGAKLKSLHDLLRVYTYRASDGKQKPLSIPTFLALLESDVDHSRIVFSSDGARISDDISNTYDYVKLREFFREVRRRGCTIEHQSAAKLAPAPNHQHLEADWFESVIK
jgi:hypothetical protein